MSSIEGRRSIIQIQSWRQVLTSKPEVQARHQVDVHVGVRIRMRRKMLGLSQERVGEALGLTFQQVQKYERGANRVSASKLYELAMMLQVPVSYFFDGLEPADNNQSDDAAAAGRVVMEFLNMSEGIELAETFPRIKSEIIRKGLLELLRSMSVERAP